MIHVNLGQRQGLFKNSCFYMSELAENMYDTYESKRIDEKNIKLLR